MSDFDGLDLRSVEEDLDDGSDDEGISRVVLAVLDGRPRSGSTPSNAATSS
jgi:hypothetical protein